MMYTKSSAQLIFVADDLMELEIEATPDSRKRPCQFSNSEQYSYDRRLSTWVIVDLWLDHIFLFSNKGLYQFIKDQKGLVPRMH